MDKYKIKLAFCLIFCLCEGETACVWAQLTETVEKHYFFDDQRLLKMTLISDFTQLIKNKEDEEYYVSNCVIYWPEGDSIKRHIRIKARGNYRKSNCFFPPLMLNFEPDSLKTVDGHYGKVKLVTHCRKAKIYREYVLKEYLIYKLYEILSPNSLKTRLIEISYSDTGKKERDNTNIGFVIEPINALCSRMDALEIKTSYFSDREINALEADRVALFMYMIGNTDWRVKSGHNIKFIKPLTHRILQVTPVPYDFDYAGFINASYATPSEWSVAKNVTERDFVGKCRINDDTYDRLIPEFRENEELFYKTIMEFEWLDEKSKKQLINYIEEFFEELIKTERFKKSLHYSCMENY